MYAERGVISNSAWVLIFVAIAGAATGLVITIDVFGGNGSTQGESTLRGAETEKTPARCTAGCPFVTFFRGGVDGEQDLVCDSGSCAVPAEQATGAAGCPSR